MTKREEVTKQVSVKYSEENSVLWEVSYLNVFTQVGGVGVNAYLSLIEKGRGGRLFTEILPPLFEFGGCPLPLAPAKFPFF